MSVRDSRWWIVLIPVFFVALICGVILLPGAFEKRDPREYAKADDSVTYGSGSLERDLLPHYQVTLPCDMTELRYADDESLIGPEGTLYLSFSTSPACLQAFINSFRGTPDRTQMAGGSLGFPLDMAQPQFGWTFPASRTYDVYQVGEDDGVNTGAVVVDSSGDPVVVWVAVDHY